MEDVTKLDLYDLLGIEVDATNKEIRTAYRKKALSCHPDKNPDNPSAGRLFLRLSRALEILTDGAAKDAYDKILKARKAAQLRTRQLDSKRRKLKEDLEQRERDAAEQQLSSGQRDGAVDAEQKLKAEIERLRKEGSRQLAEEAELMKEQLRAEKEKLEAADGRFLPRLKATWRHQKHEEPPYTQASLIELFQKYGNIAGIVVSSKGRALIEYEKMESAEDALKSETGLPSSPLIVSWATAPPNPQPCAPPKSAAPSPTVKEPHLGSAVPASAAPDDRDYESIVLTRLRQAQERKRLIQQMKDEEGT